MATVLGDIQWNALTKELYPDGLPAEIMMRKHVFLTKVQKDGDAYGDHMTIPVVFDNPAGRSADIGQLLQAAGSYGTGLIAPTQSRKFLVYLSSDYAATWINELTIRKAANDRGAFVNARKFEIDGLLRQLGNSMGHAIYRDGTGSAGRLDGTSALTGTTFTLLTRADAKFFWIGMQLDAISNVSNVPTLVRALTGSARPVVSKVDEDGGVITCLTDSAGVAITNLSTYWTGLTNTDFLAQAGDFTIAAGGGKLRGLAAWLPLAAPVSGDNFWGVDRSVHPTRLAGNRLNDPTAPAEDSIMALAEVMHERGASPDCVLVSPRQFTKISKRLNSKVEYDGAGGDVKYGFMTFGIATSAGILPVYADPDCPETQGYILSLDSWRVKHLGLPEIVTTDGLSALRRPGLDQIEVRCRYYAQLVCYAPGDNGVFAYS